MMKRMIRGRKVLIVLDDVDNIEQLEELAGSPDWFKLGSRVIITTRDKQVLAHRVKLINEVNLLSRAEAICLLSKHAFERDIPIEGYDELSKEVVQYAGGLPLTIKVLGSFLHGLNVPVWKSTLNKLKKIPWEKTMEKLEISYDGLEPHFKEIFLDVVCLLKGWKKDKAVIALKSCGSFAEVGLRVLEQRSLIKFSEHGELEMHDHIEEMGKYIIRRLHPDNPEKHSRLWIREEIVDILTNDLATKATQCIQLIAHFGLNFEILLNGLANMKELRFLQVVSSLYKDVSEWNVDEDEVSKWNDENVYTFDEDSLHLPNALRFMRWDYYPFSSLPKTFQPNNLVGLEMHCSKMVKLWKDGEEKPFLKLRFLQFHLSDLRTLDLRVAPKLETLSLEICSDLEELRFQVTPNLKELRIYCCWSLKKLHMPDDSPKLRSLDLNGSELRTLHLGVTPNLETLTVTNCENLVDLQISAECPKLVNLDLSGCIQVAELPEEIGRLECLKELDITGTGIRHLPQSLFRMKSLRIVGSRQLLESCGFISEIKTFDAETVDYKTFRTSSRKYFYVETSEISRT